MIKMGMSWNNTELIKWKMPGSQHPIFWWTGTETPKLLKASPNLSNLPKLMRMKSALRISKDIKICHPQIRKSQEWFTDKNFWEKTDLAQPKRDQMSPNAEWCQMECKMLRTSPNSKTSRMTGSEILDSSFQSSLLHWFSCFCLWGQKVFLINMEERRICLKIEILNLQIEN